MTTKLKRRHVANPKSKSKFKHKLTVEERRTIYFAHKNLAGASTRVLAAIFKVDDSVVARIIGERSVAYRDIRKSYSELGPAVFEAKFLDEKLLNKVREGTAAQMIQRESRRQQRSSEERAKRIEARAKQLMRDGTSGAQGDDATSLDAE